MGKLERIEMFLKNIRYISFAPPGHYYSPLPSVSEVKKAENVIWPEDIREIPGIDLNLEEQKEFIASVEKYYHEMPFGAEKEINLRYYFNNPYYMFSDGIFFYFVLRNYKPSKVIEVGSGYSSCLLLDTNEVFFNNSIKCTFIEPYPERLKSLIKQSDLDRNTVLQKNLQDIPLSVFQELNENDILFIDSTHVSKINSDVNYIFHQILPILKKGVLIHFHDIFYPFEYPKEWTYTGRAWNEIYMLSSFLQYNSHFKIVAFNTYLQTLFKEEMQKSFPLLFKNQNIYGSIWIQKIA